MSGNILRFKPIIRVRLDGREASTLPESVEVPLGILIRDNVKEGYSQMCQMRALVGGCCERYSFVLTGKMYTSHYLLKSAKRERNAVVPYTKEVMRLGWHGLDGKV